MPFPVDPAAPAAEVDRLTIRYGDRAAVSELSFRAEQREITALLGPNGAGKTSTVETLEGYRRPTSGQVRVLGLDPWTDHTAVVPHIGVMLQTGGVATGIRPPEVLRLFASYYDDPVDPDDLLERVCLRERARSTWRSLSGGEQQRLSLALALVGRPALVFLDEPTAGIDPSGRQLIRSIISDLRADGVAVLLTTHDLDEAEKLADRVIIIDHGQLLADASPAELMATGRADELHFGAPGGLDVRSLGAAIGAPVTEDSPGEYRVATAPTPATVAAVTAWLAEHDLPLADLRAGRQRLEDVFLRLTRTTDGRADAGGGPAIGEQPASRRGRRRRRSARR